MKKVKSLNGLIGFVNSDNLIGKIVKYFSRTKISHTFIGYRDKFTLNVTFPSVCVSRLKKKKKEKVTFYRIKPSLSARIKIALDNLFDEYVDTSYNWRKVIGYVWVWYNKKFNHRAVKNPFNKEKEAVCYEIILFYLRDELGLPGFENIDTHDSKFVEKMHNVISSSKLFEEVEYVG